MLPVHPSQRAKEAGIHARIDARLVVVHIQVFKVIIVVLSAQRDLVAIRAVYVAPFETCATIRNQSQNAKTVLRERHLRGTIRRILRVRIGRGLYLDTLHNLALCRVHHAEEFLIPHRVEQPVVRIHAEVTGGIRHLHTLHLRHVVQRQLHQPSPISFPVVESNPDAFLVKRERRKSDPLGLVCDIEFLLIERNRNPFLSLFPVTQRLVRHSQLNITPQRGDFQRHSPAVAIVVHLLCLRVNRIKLAVGSNKHPSHRPVEDELYRVQFVFHKIAHNGAVAQQLGRLLPLFHCQRHTPLSFRERHSSLAVGSLRVRLPTHADITAASGRRRRYREPVSRTSGRPRNSQIGSHVDIGEASRILHIDAVSRQAELMLVTWFVFLKIVVRAACNHQQPHQCEQHRARFVNYCSRFHYYLLFRVLNL